jgi:hypothetical protein
MLVDLVLLTLLTLIVFRLVYDKPEVGIFLILLHGSILPLFRFYFLAEVGPRRIFVEDILFVDFVAIFLIRRLGHKAPILKGFLPWKLFLVTVGFSILNVIRGYLSFGPEAIGWARIMAYPLSVVCYLSTFEYKTDRMKKIFVVTAVVSIAIIAIAYSRWIGILSTPFLEQYEGSWEASRVIERESIMLLLLFSYALLMAIMDKIIKIDVGHSVLLALLFIAIIIAQTRSAWIMLALGLVFVLYRRGLNALKYLSVPTMVVACLLYFMIIFDPGVFDKYKQSLAAAYAETQGEGSTYEFRSALNALYISQMDGTAYLLGTPFGTPPPVYSESSVGPVSYGLHNEYVEVLYYTGVFSFAAFVFFHLIMLKRTVRYSRNENERFKKTVLEFFLLSIITYMIFFFANSYDVSYTVLIGLSLSVGAQHERDAKVLNAKNG